MGSCFLGIGVGVVGILASASAVALGMVWYRVGNWPAVPALIKRAEIRTRRNPIGAGVVAQEYRPVIIYEYEVNGKKYWGKRVKLYEGSLWTLERAQAERALIEPGECVRVRVGPGNPNRSVLDPSMGRREFDVLAMILVAGALITGVGYWVVGMSCGNFSGLFVLPL